MTSTARVRGGASSVGEPRLSYQTEHCTGQMDLKAMSIPEWNTKGFPLLWHSAHILLGEDACSLVYLVQGTSQRLSQSLEAEEPNCALPCGQR